MEEQQKFDDFKTKELIEIYGSTTISHAKRVRMGLTIAEYTVADFVAYANSKRKLVTFEYAYRRIGLSKELLLPILASLRDKEFITIDGSNIRTTEKWDETFRISQQWFEEFWFYKGKAVWPGSKKEAQAQFEKTCREYEPQYIISCRDAYMDFMAHPDNSYRKLMGAAVFLNPKTERFNEQWRHQLHNLTGKHTPMPRQVEKISRKEKENLFQ